jgi:hypothetical protein
VKIQLTPDEVKVIIRKYFPTSTEIQLVDHSLDGRCEAIWDYAEVTLPLGAPATPDSDNFIDPGCGSKFSPDFSIPGSFVECIRPYGHTPPCEGGGYSWGADLAEFEPMAPVSKSPELRLTDDEVIKIVDGVMKSGEPRKFLGVDVDLPEPPPVPCLHCSGSVINHSPECIVPREVLAKHQEENPNPVAETDGDFGPSKPRKKYYDIIDGKYSLHVNLGPNLQIVQDEKPIEYEEPF